MIANYDQIRDVNPTYQNRSLLIIYPSSVSASFLTRINDFANWKHQKGFTVTLASTAVTDSANTEIKAYIQNAYNTWAVKPEYVILIGDAEGSITLPFWRFSDLQGSSSSYGEGDYYYTLMGGSSDYLGDLFYRPNLSRYRNTVCDNISKNKKRGKISQYGFQLV